MNLRNITLENIYIEAENGMTCVDADGIHAAGIRLITKNSPAINISNCRNIELKKADLITEGHPLVSISGKRSRAINLNITNDNNDNEISISPEVKNDEITLF